MNPERWRVVDRIYREALSRKAGKERAVFVADACARDTALRREIALLLGQAESPELVLHTRNPSVSLAFDRLDSTNLVGRQFGVYRITTLLGVGGMGEVYQARDTRLGRDVAIKLLARGVSHDAHRLARLEREAHILATLNHPNIGAIYGLEEVPAEIGGSALVLELVTGETLADRIRRGPVPVAEALTIARQVAEALAAAHEKGIVHRDLKPANIKITSGGIVKVLDFGIAKVIRVDAPSDLTHAATVTSDMTREGVLLGTVAYMSPEQVRGGIVDKRTDIWAFGCVLFEMLTGRSAFAGQTISDTIAGILERDPDWHSVSDATPPTIHRLLRRCLDKHRDGRLDDIADACVEIEEARTTPRNRSASLVLATTLLIVAMTGGIVSIWPSTSERPPVMATSSTGSPNSRVVATETQVTSIVALPSKVYGDREFFYLSDAVPATLSTHLAQIEGIETKVPPGSLEVEDVKGDFTRIADAYGATAYVLSSVTAERERLVLNLQLVEPRTRRVRWSNQYSGNRDSYIDLVNQAAEGLRTALRPAATSVRLPTSPTVASATELELRRGQYFANRYNNRHEPADFDLAFSSFQRALQLDPTLAEAAAEMASLYLYKNDVGASAAETMPEAERWARQSLQIDPQSPKGWSALVWVEYYQPRASLRKMVEYGLRAATFGRRCGACQTTLAVALAGGTLDLGIAASLEARRLDPLFLYPKLNTAESLRNLGRPAEALAFVDEALRLEPDSSFGLQLKTLILVDLGRLDEATATLRRVEPFVRDKRMPALFFWTAQHAAARAGVENKTADAALDRIMAALNDPQTSTHDLDYVQADVVPILSRNDRTERAVQILMRATQGGSMQPYDWFLLNPHLETLRTDKRFRTIMAKADAQFKELLDVLNQARVRGEFPEYLEQPLAELLTKLKAAVARQRSS